MSDKKPSEHAPEHASAPEAKAGAAPGAIAPAASSAPSGAAPASGPPGSVQDAATRRPSAEPESASAATASAAGGMAGGPGAPAEAGPEADAVAGTEAAPPDHPLPALAPQHVFAAAPPPVYGALAFGGLKPAAPLSRVWLRSGEAGAPDAARRIRAAHWAPQIWEGRARGTVLLFSGRTEYMEKYLRVIARLTAMGFHVATLDWRGQGLSERRHGPMLGHVDDFAEYQQDVAAFLGWAQAQDLPGPQVLLAHSMGGAIGLRAMIDGRLAPDAAMFSAPFWGMPVSGAAGFLARGLAFGAVAFGLSHREIMPDLGEETYVLARGFEGNVLTSDQEHWNWMRAQAEARPELTLGSPSMGFVSAAFRELEALRHAPPPQIPILALLGDGEQVVSPEAIRDFTARAPGAVLARIPGARHEGLMEGPGRAPGRMVWAAMARFLRDHGI